MAITEGGRDAVTHYKVIERHSHYELSLVECTLQTGRTHQIRVHMKHLGYPLVGDPVYGRTRHKKSQHYPEGLKKALLDFPRQALHARKLELTHPISGEAIIAEAPMPDDFSALLALIKHS
jgi:23S rRNA pseudouridine1911/1915/1917 synthase